MTLRIRPAVMADLPAVLQLYQRSGLDRQSPLELPAAEAWFRRLQQYPSYRLWVAQQEKDLVGSFTLLIMDNLVHQGQPSGVVEGVAVAPDYQGQGIGKAMMQRAIAECRAARCYKLALSTNLNRGQAHAFYESLGFEKHGYSFRIDLEAPCVPQETGHGGRDVPSAEIE